MLSIKNRIEMETTVKLYSLNYSNVKTYLFALLFVAGNIALPQLCHLVPAGVSLLHGHQWPVME